MRFVRVTRIDAWKIESGRMAREGGSDVIERETGEEKVKVVQAGRTSQEPSERAIREKRYHNLGPLMKAHIS